MANEEKITLTLDREHYPLILSRYGLEGAKKTAVSMALAQYKERPLTAAMLYSCLSMLEIDLERMFPPLTPKTAEEQAEAEAEAAEEEAMYRAAIANWKPYLVNGKQAKVSAMGYWPDYRSNEGVHIYPVWITESGELVARIYLDGWDWLYLANPDQEEDWEEEDEDEESE